MTRTMTLLEPLDKAPQTAGAVGFVPRAAEDAVAQQLLRPFLPADREVAILAGFDAYGRLAGLETIDGETSGRCIIGPEAWRRLLGRRIVTVIIAHNHPSGQARPSEADIRCTRDAAQFLRLIGVDLADHLIFVDGGHFSFRSAHLI